MTRYRERMTGSLARGLTLTLVLAGGLTAPGCSTAVSPSATQARTPAAATPSTSASSSQILLTATTQPADAAPPGAITIGMSSFKFDPSALAATPGTVSFFLKNVGTGSKHDVAIGPDQGSRLAVSDVVFAGNAALFTVQGLKAGTYVFFCTLPGHAEAGMVGTLTVR